MKNFNILILACSIGSFSVASDTSSKNAIIQITLDQVVQENESAGKSFTFSSCTKHHIAQVERECYKRCPNNFITRRLTSKTSECSAMEDTRDRLKKMDAQIFTLNDIEKAILASLQAQHARLCPNNFLTRSLTKKTAECRDIEQSLEILTRGHWWAVTSGDDVPLNKLTVAHYPKGKLRFSRYGTKEEIQELVVKSQQETKKKDILPAAADKK